MSKSWRIKTKFIDKSETVNLNTAFLGYTVIDAPKGQAEPLLIGRGATQKILDTYGYPSVDNPAIQDAIDFNLVADLWISAPHSNGLYGGVFVTKDGSLPFVSGVSTQAISDYSAINCEYQIGVGDGTTTNFSIELPLAADYYNNQSIDIEVDDTSLTITATDAEPEILSSSPDVGDGTYTRATGVVEFTFDTAPTAGEIITATYTVDISDVIYFTLFDANPQSDDLAVQISNVNSDDVFTMSVYRYDQVQKDYYEVPSSPYQISIDPLGVDGNGRNIYIEDIFDDENVIFKGVVETETFDTFVDDTAIVALAGGDRGDALTGSNLAAGYDYLQDAYGYPAAVVFNSTDDSEVATKFETLRSTYQTRTRYLLCGEDISAANIIADPTGFKNNIDNRGIYYYGLNWGIHQDIYRSKPFNCSNMGLIAGKLMEVLLNGPGGNPQWLDENGIGGQLGSSILSLNQSATQTELKQLDNIRVNGIINHPQYSVLIEGGRTTQTLDSDYAYIAQSSLADYIVKAIEDQVLPRQLAKLNDIFHREVVRSKCNTILTSVSAWLNDFYVLCDETNNTPEIFQQQKFVVTVGVQFTPYAQTIEFIFINTPQGVSVEETIKKGA